MFALVAGFRDVVGKGGGDVRVGHRRARHTIALGSLLLRTNPPSFGRLICFF